MTEEEFAELCAIALALYQGNATISVDAAFTRGEAFFRAMVMRRPPLDAPHMLESMQLASAALKICAVHQHVSPEAAFARVEGFFRGKEARRVFIGQPRYTGAPLGAPQALPAGPSPTYPNPNQTPLPSGQEPRQAAGYGPHDISRVGDGAPSAQTLATVAAPSDPNAIGSHEGCDVECFRAFLHCGKCAQFAHAGTCNEPVVIGRVNRPMVAKKAGPTSNFRGPTKEEPAMTSDAPHLPPSSVVLPPGVQR